MNMIHAEKLVYEYDKRDEERRNELPLLMMERLKQIDNRYECVITVDYEFVAKAEAEE